MYYDREGNRISERDYLARAMDQGYRRVAVDYVGEACISTVWLGADRAYGRRAEPEIFETIVFDGEVGPVRERYSTIDDARRGHAAMLARVLASIWGVPTNDNAIDA